MSYADSLRQQARWIREALDPSTPDDQRISMDDIDIDELEEAANELDRLATLPDRDGMITDAEATERMKQGLAAIRQREALQSIDALCSGERHTVNESNAFEHFAKLNRTMVEVREIARGALEGKAHDN